MKQYGPNLRAFAVNLLTQGYVSIDRTRQILEGLGMQHRKLRRLIFMALCSVFGLFTKANLPFGSVTMLEYQIQKLRMLGIEDIIISGSGRELAGTRCVPDIYPHKGPLSGIHACLEAALHDSVLFLSVDTPLIPIETLQTLLDMQPFFLHVRFVLTTT